MFVPIAGYLMGMLRFVQPALQSVPFRCRGL